MDNPCKFCDKASMKPVNGSWKYCCNTPCEKAIRFKREESSFYEKINKEINGDTKNLIKEFFNEQRNIISR